MNILTILTAIPASARKWIYFGYAVIGLVLGAIQLVDSTNGTPDPVWLKDAFAVLGFLAAAFGITAHVNVPLTPQGKHEG